MMLTVFNPTRFKKWSKYKMGGPIAPEDILPTDYVLVWHVNLHGTFPMRDVLSVEDAAKLAVFANKLEGRK